MTFLLSRVRGRARLAAAALAACLAFGAGAVLAEVAPAQQKRKPVVAVPPAPAPQAPTGPVRTEPVPAAPTKPTTPGNTGPQRQAVSDEGEAPEREPVGSTPVQPAITPPAPAAEQPETQTRADSRGRPAGRRDERPRGRSDVGAAADRAAAGSSPSGEAATGAAEATADAAADGDATGVAEAPEPEDDGGNVVSEIVEVVPDSVKMAFAGLLALSLVLAGFSLLSAGHARSLGRQRRVLLQEVGLLQTALLPPVPEQLGALRTSVAYRPAEGPGAGGDFYDALPLSGDRAAFILGDVSGHGRAALVRTAFLRYTLRAYVEAGLEPRMALQVAGRVIDQHLDGDFATAVIAVHDPATATLTFACAGHPAPIVIGRDHYEPVLPGGAPPLGMGLRTGLRQTTLPLPPGSLACLFTDGLTEARTERGILGRPRLGDIVAELGSRTTAADLLERVADEARLVTDDMATCLLSPTAGVTAGGFRMEQLELGADELDTNTARRFLEACGVTGEEAAHAELDAAEQARRHGGAVLSVTYGNPAPTVEVLPAQRREHRRGGRSLASRRCATATSEPPASESPRSASAPG